MSLVRISAIAAAAVLHGLYSFPSIFSFLWLVFLDVLFDYPYRSEVRVDTNAELVVLFVNLVFVASWYEPP